jgi:thiol-disulfide isomerase/thioredoxin
VLKKAIIAGLSIFGLLLIVGLGLFGEKFDVFKSGQKIARGFYDQNDQFIALEKYKGKKVYIHFWASWCAPCTEEIPHLIESSKRFPKDVIFLAVAIDKSWVESQKLLPKELGSKIIWTRDSNGSFAREMGSFQYPETIVLNEKLLPTQKWVGAQSWNEPQFLSRFFTQ